MKRIRPTPILVGKFVSEAWRVPIRQVRRSGGTSKLNHRKRTLKPHEPQVVTCSFCGNIIRLERGCNSVATARRASR